MVAYQQEKKRPGNCRWCTIATMLAGMAYFCRPCWRRMYRNKKG